MAHRLGEPVAPLEAALVAERDGVPSARFQDHELIRRTPANQVAGTPRAAFLLDRANDGEATGGSGGLPGDRGDGRRERPLGVDCPTTEEAIPLAVHRDESGDGIHVPEEQHFARSAPPEGDDVAGFVPPRGEPHRAQA